jgi:Aerotolerance regulator N-terminal
MIAFASPWVLAAFVVLPVIWWLLRLTPPRPVTEIFPPLKILARLIKRDETPDKSPWWLTLLRLALASLLILALAKPVLNPQAEVTSGDGPQALLIDNSWLTTADWESRMATARAIIDGAGKRSAPVLLAFSAMQENADVGPFDAPAALEKLAATKPEPVPSNRKMALEKIAKALGETRGADLAILSDGLSAGELQTPKDAFTNVEFYTPANRMALALVGSVNGAESLDITAARDPSRVGTETFDVSAFDSRSRPIGTAALEFAAGEETAIAKFVLPFDVRNDIATVSIDGVASAGSVQLFDAGSGRRRVGLISATNNEGAQPLLAPLYYIREALAPFADLVEPEGDNLDTIITTVLEDRPSVLVLADVGVISSE